LLGRSSSATAVGHQEIVRMVGSRADVDLRTGTASRRSSTRRAGFDEISRLLESLARSGDPPACSLEADPTGTRRNVLARGRSPRQRTVMLDDRPHRCA
jgi:hypothetical protein